MHLVISTSSSNVLLEKTEPDDHNEDTHISKYIFNVAITQELYNAKLFVELELKSGTVTEKVRSSEIAVGSISKLFKSKF